MNLEPSFVPNLAFDYLKEVEISYSVTGCFSEQDLEVFHSFFGEHLVDATELLEKCKIIKYSLTDNSRSIFKIITKHEQYSIFDNINFCNCSIFRLQVLELRNAITCKHILAVKLGEITGHVVKETITGSQLVDFLNEQLNCLDGE
ncbi:zinc finger SWIM domain-containing protein 7-like [Diorhabda sublineata]|uniref:zinc finger SWIM domain-containing protein 7-like n=1 Tax=Diorhabda sublineata TaxID=1163346 RepID=UPI0024E18A5B|nr:zinc finger SWIM domain-containing protein 7-like [Diorhabda sublineata]